MSSLSRPLAERAERFALGFDLAKIIGLETQQAG